MPLQEHHQIISVDDHLIEPPRVWQDRLPAKYRDEGPRIIETGGNHLWSYDGQIFPTLGLNAVAGEQKADGPVPNLMPELLLDERLQVRFVVDN